MGLSGKADGFVRFVRQHFRPVFHSRGYRFAGQGGVLTRGPATARLTFMRYSNAFAGRFDVRMGLTLDTYYPETLGVLAAADLSIRTFGSIEAASWYWPAREPEWSALAASVEPALAEGSAWLESLLDVRALAEHLERDRRFSADVDLQFDSSIARMVSVGIYLADSSQRFTPRAGTLRPDKVKALSYCYELLSDWPRAVEAWRDYLSTQVRASKAATERLSALERARDA